MAAPVRRLLVAGVMAVLIAGCGGSSRSDVVREGRGLFTDNGCSTCHGGRGEGDVGPALTDVAATFASCDDQVEWVRLGSDGWLGDHGDTYGDTSKPVKGGMPSLGESLSIPEIRTVVAYERIDFGGLDEAAVRVDCGV